MNDISTLVSAPHQEVSPGTSVRAAEVLRRRCSPTTLRSIVVAWNERERFRGELEQIKADPHLLYDIGLTRRQVEAEITRLFWAVLR